MNRPEINVTPLIDVLLVLLIIFMIVSPTRPSSMDARIPSEPDNTAKVDPNPLTLVVTVADDLSISLNKDRFDATVDSPEKVISELRSIFAQREQNNATDSSGTKIVKTVFIKAPKNMSYGIIAKAVDAVKTAGADPVSLQIDGL